MENPWQRKSNTTGLGEFLKSPTLSRRMKVPTSASQQTPEEQTLQEVNYLSMVSRLSELCFLMKSRMEFCCIVQMESPNPFLEVESACQVKLIKN